MERNEYIKTFNNLNRLHKANLITENEYLQACAILDRKFAKAQKNQ